MNIATAYKLPVGVEACLGAVRRESRGCAALSSLGMAGAGVGRGRPGTGGALKHLPGSRKLLIPPCSTLRLFRRCCTSGSAVSVQITSREGVGHTRGTTTLESFSSASPAKGVMHAEDNRRGACTGALLGVAQQFRGMHAGHR